MTKFTPPGAMLDAARGGPATHNGSYGQKDQHALREALAQAEDNGYDMLAMSDLEIAEDLVQFNSDYETTPVEVLLPMIAAWRLDKVAK